MKKNKFAFLIMLIPVIYGICGIRPGCAADTNLTQEQSTLLKKLIDNRLKKPAEKKFVNNEWTEAQRVAEFICRPLAEKVVKNHFPAADKILFDQGHNNRHHLVSATLLEGNGQYRTGNNWVPFYYQCELSAKTGEALEFRFMRKKKVMAPGPVIIPHGERK
ncbi:hypothetical protein ID80_004776 [Salmonella enterica subsp. enterica serovar Ball]|nr:hypothetical protein [Salmonella enterica subsp. salamae]EDV5024109.1 hypothetical protein [Salmonella enterica subsp. enterica serovar Ball]